MTFGAHKGRTFTETYEQYPDYVDWTLSEAEHSAGFCAGMRRWMTYCHNRREDEMQGTVYMVAEDAGEDEIDPDDVLLYLDSGCNVTCHGELWEHRYVRATGNRPTWVHQGEGSVRGIGGGTRTTGVKEFYVGLEGENGERVPAGRDCFHGDRWKQCTAAAFYQESAGFRTGGGFRALHGLLSAVGSYLQGCERAEEWLDWIEDAARSICYGTRRDARGPDG